MTVTAPSSLLNPFPWYAAMRERSPVVRDSQSGKWMIFDYAGVQRTLSDWKAFSSERSGPRNRTVENAIASSMISTDPPRHRQLRALVEQVFTPKQVRALAPRIEELVDELLGQVEGQGRIDFIHDFAEPLPVIVIAEILGIPASERADFKRWSDALVNSDPNGSREMGAYFARLVEERRTNPGEDLISGLMAAQVGGEHLDPQELLGFCMLLLAAGNETTTNLLANTLLCWRDAPGAYEQVLADRELLGSSIEESLRHRSPVQSMLRVAAQDVELGGQVIEAGSPVISWIGSANRDEAQFERADTFDPARSPNRHLAFGNGVHFCLGAPLARLEASIALNAVLDRLPLWQIEDAPLEPLPSSMLSGVMRLPLRLG